MKLRFITKLKTSHFKLPEIKEEFTQNSILLGDYYEKNKCDILYN